MNNVKTFRNSSGFSLMEVMVALGISGIVFLGVAHLSRRSTHEKKDFQVRMESNELMSEINLNLAIKDLCNENFKNRRATRNTFSSIQNNGAPLYQIGQTFGFNNEIRISNLSTKAESKNLVALKVSYQKSAGPSGGGGAPVYEKDIPLVVTLVDNNDPQTPSIYDDDTIVDCTASTSNGDTGEAVNASCNGEGVIFKDPDGSTLPENGEYLSGDEQCIHFGYMVGDCPAGKEITKFIVTGAGDLVPNYVPVCADITGGGIGDQSCPDGEMIESISSAGIITCRAITIADVQASFINNLGYTNCAGNSFHGVSSSASTFNIGCSNSGGTTTGGTTTGGSTTGGATSGLTTGGSTTGGTTTGGSTTGGSTTGGAALSGGSPSGGMGGGGTT